MDPFRDHTTEFDVQSDRLQNVTRYVYVQEKTQDNTEYCIGYIFQNQTILTVILKKCMKNFPLTTQTNGKRSHIFILLTVFNNIKHLPIQKALALQGHNIFREFF